MEVHKVVAETSAFAVYDEHELIGTNVDNTTALQEISISLARLGRREPRSNPSPKVMVLWHY